MRTGTKIWSSIIASLAFSALILLFAFSILRDIQNETSRLQAYSAINDKVAALNLSLAMFPSQPDTSRILQIKAIRASLEELLEPLQSFDAREELLLRQIRTNARELGYSFEKLITPPVEAKRAQLAERRNVLVSQLWMKTQFISDDMQDLMEISQARIKADQQKASILILGLIVALILANACIFFFSGRSIMRVQKRLRGALAEAQEGLTQRLQAEKELQLLNEMLEQRVAERTELAETRARQLQALAVELIETEEQERRRIARLLHEDLQQILASARFQLQAAHSHGPSQPMLANVERLLEESITKSRRLSHELSPAVLYHAGLGAALNWLAGQMKEQFGLHVGLQTAAGQPLESVALKVFLFRAVQELLLNVVKHSGVNSAQVALSGSQDGIIIAIRDRGRGFDPDILESLPPQVGLGLLSIRERASYIGGRLEIQSAPGQGTCLTLTVPLSLSETEVPQGIDRQPGYQPPGSGGPQPAAGGLDIRVLFADDHKVMRQGLIRLMAGKPNIQVVGEAADGREAVELARQLRPDVIVMDISMPEMDGIEATRIIKADLPDMRVIGLSMLEDEQAEHLMRQAGAESFVSKAASAADLLKAIYGARPVD